MNSIGHLALRYLTTGLALVLTTAHISAAPIGEATKAKNQVTGQLGPVSQRISIGSNVSTDEVVSTGTSSSTELLFLDDSTLAIGAGSSVALDRYVYNPNSGAVDTLINMSKGAMRFVSSGQRTRNATIAIPNATIGIRGTEMIVNCPGSSPCEIGFKSGSGRVCPYPEGTQVTQQFRNACQSGNDALLPCGYYDLTAEDEQTSDDEGNFMTVGLNCAVTPPVTVDPSAFTFIGQQIAAGASIPGGIITTSFASVVPATIIPFAAMTAAAIAVVAVPATLNEPDTTSGQ